MFVAAASSIHTVRWVNALSERGNTVILVSLPNHRESSNKLNSNIQIIYLPFSGSKGYYLNALILQKIYHHIKPEVINVHYASGYGTLARMAHLPNIILSVWGSDVYDFPYQSKLKMHILVKNLGYAAHLASTSYSMAEQIKKIYSSAQITITPFGVDTDHFKKNDQAPHSDFVIGTVKSLSYNYGIDTIIKAFSIFQKRRKPCEKVRLVIYGKGEDEKKLRELCKMEQIENSTTFFGYIPNTDVPDALNSMDVCCFGSRNESFGVAAVEAMACEVPVVATDVSGFMEVIVPDKTGFLVKRDSPIGMADVLEKLYSSRRLRMELGKAGRQHVLELYDWQKNVDAMINLYLKYKNYN